MTKKALNQNTKYVQELIDVIEPDFVFNKEPINRFEIVSKNKNNSNLAKVQKLSILKNQINSIQNCNLKQNSQQLIMGDGNVNSDIMLIGEAPGGAEEKTGYTFQGEVGNLLHKMLTAINISRVNIYTAYAVNFRPPDDRKPTSQEIKRYSKFLKDHIAIIDPKILVLMGGTAMEAIIGSNTKITSERGKWKEIIINSKTFPLIITFNPSYLLRFPENKKFSWEDLKKIRQKIQDLNIQI